MRLEPSTTRTVCRRRPPTAFARGTAIRAATCGRFPPSPQRGKTQRILEQTENPQPVTRGRSALTASNIPCRSPMPGHSQWNTARYVLGDRKRFPTAAPHSFGAVFFSTRTHHDISPSDNFVWQTGRHTFKFGIMYARNRKDQNSRPNSYNGAINFSTTNNPNSTGDPFADALIGNFQNFHATIGGPGRPLPFQR